MNRTILAAVALILMASPATALERGPDLGDSVGGDHQAGQNRGNNDRPGGGTNRERGGRSSGLGGLSSGRGGFSTGLGDHGGHDRN